MLAWYAERFPAVEINNTFYRLPRESVLQQWASRVPAGFLFVLKASQWITHRKRLKDAGDPLGFLLGNSAVLGPARGPILFQLPPNLKIDADRLAVFLDLIPQDVRAAFEFRHASWYDDSVFTLLRQHGAALVITDSEDGSSPREATADWGYLRLRREAYSDRELTEWSTWIHARSWTEVFAFFKHEDGATGPRLASHFNEIFGG